MDQTLQAWQRSKKNLSLDEEISLDYLVLLPMELVEVRTVIETSSEGEQAAHLFNKEGQTRPVELSKKKNNLLKVLLQLVLLEEISIWQALRLVALQTPRQAHSRVLRWVEQARMGLEVDARWDCLSSRDLTLSILDSIVTQTPKKKRSLQWEALLS